jgi:DNA-binding LacI/PurR family transcriptional regulator
MPRKKVRASSPRRVRPPEKPASLRSLADYLGLSPATVSVVMNNSPAAKAIPQRTKDRVLHAARELQYRPNFFARSLSLKRGFTVGVLLPEMSEGYASLVMTGIDEYLLREGYFYFVASHHNKPDLIQEYPQMLIERSVEGLIFLNTPVSRTLSVPAVSVSGHEKVKGMTRVVMDNDKATWLALEHLVRLGHRRIAFFKGQPGSADTEFRWEGICRAAAKLGIEIRPELTVQLQGYAHEPEPSVPEEGYAYAQRLLAGRRRFTALFAFNDVSAMGAIRAFRDAGLRVPEDLSVIGFDDVQAAAYLSPRLTTVRQPLRQMGELAAMHLLQKISTNGAQNYPSEILVEPELVVRESTFAPPAPKKSPRKTRATT